MAYYNYIKALHLIFVITWFAGLFYIPRLFVYQIEAYHKSAPEKEILGAQLRLMAKRLWTIITWPSALMIIAGGIAATVLAGLGFARRALQARPARVLRARE